MKAGLVAPLYLSVSWVLTVSYQLLTDTAVKAIGVQIGLVLPSADNWINTNIETIIFVYAFTWIFVLSSVIPSAILGKERGVLTQYIVVLILSLMAFFMPDVLSITTGFNINQTVNAATILQNPAVAFLYLSAPYLFMIAIDLRGKTASRRKKLEISSVKENQLTNEQRLNKVISTSMEKEDL